MWKYHTSVTELKKKKSLVSVTLCRDMPDLLQKELIFI